jgi:hypothetical protein
MVPSGNWRMASTSSTTAFEPADDVLIRLPADQPAFDLPPEYVFRAVGVPYRP